MPASHDVIWPRPPHWHAARNQWGQAVRTFGNNSPQAEAAREHFVEVDDEWIAQR